MNRITSALFFLLLNFAHSCAAVSEFNRTNSFQSVELFLLGRIEVFGPLRASNFRIHK